MDPNPNLNLNLNPPVYIQPLTAKLESGQEITVQVIRDDLLTGGTKQRALPVLITSNPTANEFIYAGPAFGFAQVALAYVARLMKKQAVLFVARQQDGHLQPLTARAAAMGATIKEVFPPNTLKDVQQAGEDYVKKRNEQCPSHQPVAVLLPFGLNCELFINALETSLKQALPPELLMEEKNPARVWVTCGSGALLATLSKIWPKTTFLAVQVGKKIWPDQLG